MRLGKGSDSVSQYALDFHILAAKCSCDQAALQGIFLKGLFGEIKDKLAASGESSRLEGL